MPATYEKIATTTLGSATTEITFSSIAASWTDLRIIFAGYYTGSASNYALRFNADTGTNYSYTRLSGNGTAAASTRATSASSAQCAYIYNVPGLIQIDIFSYAGSTNKTFLSLSAGDGNGAGEVRTYVGLWRSTSAITSITLMNGDFSIGTTATLYGILKA